MKRILLLAALLAIGVQTMAQDLITKKDATEIEAKILRITSSEIEYKAWNNLDGPIYVLPVRDVFTIKYENGTRDVFTQYKAKSLHGNDTRTTTDYPRYEGDFAAGFAAASDGWLNRIEVATVHGVRVMPYLYAGLGVSCNYFYNINNEFWDWLNEWEYGDGYEVYRGTFFVVPVFANFKGYYPITDKITLYASVDLGASIAILGDLTGTDFYTSIGPGVQFGQKNALDVSIRYQHLGASMNAALFRVGIRF